MKQFLQRHRLAAFFVLAYALSWYPWILALLRGKTSGPNPLGPLLAGIIVTAVVNGRAGLREFFTRIVRGRVGAGWYALVVLIPCALLATAAAVTLCFVDRSQIASLSTDKLRELPDRFIFILLFIGLGEEPGWRGFALPHLQLKNSPLKASLILAPLWALWHLPLLGNEFPWPIVPPFLLSLWGGTMLLTWVFNQTKGSVLLPMLFHATINTISAGLIFPLFSGGELVSLWWTYGVLSLCAGFFALRLSAKAERPTIFAPILKSVA